ncbi:MAG: glycosyltransferase [Caulobacteraceae bacterium]|nr:glycosyltransferase [Caulobacteraceae bacterium]
MELGSAHLLTVLTASQREIYEAVTTAALNARSNHLKVLAQRGVIPLGGDRFGRSTEAPWVELKPDATAGASLGRLVFQITGDTPGTPLANRIYLDYGQGYQDHLSVVLPDAKDGLTALYIVQPARLRSLRWCPAAQGGGFRFLAATYQDGPNVDAALAELGSSDPDVLHVARDLSRVRRDLSRGEFTPETAIGLSARLALLGGQSTTAYDEWLRRWVHPNATDYVRMAEMAKALPHKPFFSFVMPVYDPPPALLEECLDSLLDQTYTNFEICIADDRSPNPEIRHLLERYAARDDRIKLVFRSRNGHISAASNSALALATGDFVVLVDHDDLVPDYCLLVVAHYINQYPQAQILYSDEDKITVAGQRYDPYFKGDFDPFLMFGHNMVSHLGVYRRDLVEAIGGFRQGLEGSQDYDLVLRAIERAGVETVVHIPHVLYHWRAIPGSTAVSGDEKSYAVVAAQQAVNGHFERTGLPLRSVDGLAPGVNAVKPARDYDTLISIIIPTRDGVEYLRPCIDSILANDHSNVEIIVVDNGSQDPATLAYLKQVQQEEAGVVRVLSYPHPFNFSEMNNFAVEKAKGDVLCFLNNDTEVIAKDWLVRARGLIALPDVGIVGARLLYPDGTVQHFGVATGMARHRVASTPHVGLPQEAGGYFGKARLLQQFSAVTAACLFIRTELFRLVGGYEPSLRVAYNDVDLCLKVRAAGHKVIADPQILLTHKESKSRGSDQSGAKAERLDNEAAIMRARWGESLDRDPFWSVNHDLDHIDFRLAHPPRQPMPWRRAGDVRDTEPGVTAFRPDRNYLSNLWAARKVRAALIARTRRASAGIGVIVQVGAASPEQTVETLRSLQAQALAPSWSVVFVDASAPSGQFEALAAVASSQGAVAIRGAGLAEGVKAALAIGGSDQVMILQAGDSLEPEALDRFADAFVEGVTLAYCDTIITGADTDDIQRFLAHPAFTYDGYLSRPYFNRGVTFDRRTLQQILDQAISDQLPSLTDLVLMCLETAGDVAHIPALLCRGEGRADETVETLAAVHRHLDRVNSRARASEGLASGTLRIDYPDPGGRTLVIIPTKDGVDLLRTCVDSVRRTTRDIDIVIIDHDSVEPETLAYLETLKGEVRVEPYSGPFNYSAMNNQAVARHADGYDFVLFLNNDIEAIEPGWVERMRSLAARPDVGMVGATLLFDNHTIQHAGVILGVGGCADHGQRGADFERRGERHPGYDASLVSTRDYSAVTAACMMMRTVVFVGVGGFDPDLAVGFNDTDLCLRVGSLGYRVLNDAHTVLYHHESATRSLTDDLKHPEDAVRFMRRWKLLLAKGDPFYSPLLSLTTDYDLAEVTDMDHAVRIMPVQPEILPFPLGLAREAPSPVHYRKGPVRSGRQSASPRGVKSR